MIDLKLIEELSQRLSGAMPPSLGALQSDLEKNSRALLESLLRRLDLVTREQYEVQTTLLARTRERLMLLEQRIRALEEEAVTRPPES